MLLLSCNISNKQNVPTLAEEETSPFTAIDFKVSGIYVTVDNKQYKWLKIGQTEVSNIVDLFKENYSSKWQKRLSEDLVEYLNKLDVYPKQQESFALEDVEGNARTIKLTFDSEKRQQAKDHFESSYDKDVDLNQVLSIQEAIEDLDQLEDIIHSKYSYAFLNGFNVSEEIQTLKDDIKDEITSYELALNIGKFINKFGDGHSRIQNVRFTRNGVLPFSVYSYNGKVICTKEGKLLNKDYPYLHSINEVELSKLLEISEDYFTSDASPQFRERTRVARLNRIGEILKIAGSYDQLLRIELESEDGKITSLSQEMGRPKRGERVDPIEVKHFNDIGYLSIKRMSGLSDETSLTASISELEKSKGLIIDVRGNGGGQRDIMIELAPHFINREQGFVIGNVAQLRTDNTSKNHDLSDRYLYQIEDDRFDSDAKGKLNAWSSKFSKSIVLDDSRYSPDYFLYIKGHEKPTFSNIPTVVLMNEYCFSATDIFLSTFKEIDGVTLVGTPSGGGSGRVIRYRLNNSLIKINLSSIVSFQPNGELYDGIGVHPDIAVEQSGMADFLGKTDSQLEFALKYLAGKIE